MSYDYTGHGGLDYLPCRYGKSKLLFRGPRKKMTGNYVAMLGGIETYGKFLEKPYPALVGEAMGMECVNFGCVNAGVDVFCNEDEVIAACGKSKVTVLQVLGTQNMSNRYYTVHPRRNDRFLQASDLLQKIYQNVDFTEFSFINHMLSQLQEISPERFEVISDELKAAWVARMKTLLGKIDGKTILFWFSDRSPDDPAMGDQLGRKPVMVDRDMIEAVRECATEVVEVVPSKDALAIGTKGMIYSQLDAPAAAELMGIAAHEDAAVALIEAIRKLL